MNVETGDPNVHLHRDDDRAGYALRVLRSAGDGDFHVSVVPVPADLPNGEALARYQGRSLVAPSVRVCSAIGGGRNHALYMALAGLFGVNAGIDIALGGLFEEAAKGGVGACGREDMRNALGALWEAIGPMEVARLRDLYRLDRETRDASRAAGERAEGVPG